MEKKGFHCKLTAILSADVVAYSRLMQDDEAATVTGSAGDTITCYTIA